jgi:hypothetical protein
MGQYVKDNIPYWVEGTEERIREVLFEYNENIQKFETKHSVRAGRRARKNLLELFHLCRTRRKEISAKYAEYKPVQHPSWDGIEEEDAS